MIRTQEYYIYCPSKRIYIYSHVLCFAVFVIALQRHLVPNWDLVHLSWGSFHLCTLHKQTSIRVRVFYRSIAVCCNLSCNYGRSFPTMTGVPVGDRWELEGGAHRKASNPSPVAAADSVSIPGLASILWGCESWLLKMLGADSLVASIHCLWLLFGSTLYSAEN